MFYNIFICRTDSPRDVLLTSGEELKRQVRHRAATDIQTPQPVTRDADVAECSVVDNVAAEVNLDEVGEVLEDGDEELGVDVGGSSQRQGAEAPAPVLQQGDGVVDGSWLDLKMTDLGLDEDMKVVSCTSPSADDAENTTSW